MSVFEILGFPQVTEFLNGVENEKKENPLSVIFFYFFYFLIYHSYQLLNHFNPIFLIFNF